MSATVQSEIRDLKLTAPWRERPVNLVPNAPAKAATGDHAAAPGQVVVTFKFESPATDVPGWPHPSVQIRHPQGALAKRAHQRRRRFHERKSAGILQPRFVLFTQAVGLDAEAGRA